MVFNVWFYFTDGGGFPEKVCAVGQVSGARGEMFKIKEGWPMSWPKRQVSGSGGLWHGTSCSWSQSYLTPYHHPGRQRGLTLVLPHHGK